MKACLAPLHLELSKQGLMDVEKIFKWRGEPRRQGKVLPMVVTLST